MSHGRTGRCQEEGCKGRTGTHTAGGGRGCRKGLQRGLEREGQGSERGGQGRAMQGVGQGRGGSRHKGGMEGGREGWRGARAFKGRLPGTQALGMRLLAVPLPRAFIGTRWPAMGTSRLPEWRATATTPRAPATANAVKEHAGRVDAHREARRGKRGRSGTPGRSPRALGGRCPPAPAALVQVRYPCAVVAARSRGE